jgi:4-hydroxybenzoate polyprenyltransferase
MSASHFRTLLVLGRVSNLPTVWSNCLAAWLLAGGSYGSKFALLLASGSCLYLGGMVLNDACDVEFDRRHRTERPIPSGRISRRAAWAWAIGGLLAGALLAVPMGGRALGCALVLLTAIVAYDLWHKRHPCVLGLVAGCRFLLYLLAGIAAVGTASPRLLTAAGGLAAYVLGISLLARHESGMSRPSKWPLVLLALPVVTAGLNTSAGAFGVTIFAMVLFIAWLVATLGPLWRAKPQTGRGISWLLAGLVLADGLQVSTVQPSWTQAVVLTGLFGLTLLLQRRIPAT